MSRSVDICREVGSADGPSSMNMKVPGKAAGKDDDSKVFILANSILDVDSCIFSVPMLDSSKLYLQAMVVRDATDIDGLLCGCSRLLAVIGL
jgi:hypothetical protein